MPSFGRLGQLFKIPPFSVLKLHSAGVIGPRNISLIGILIFLLLAKFRNPMITPSGRKVTGEEGREKKHRLIMDTEFRAAHLSRIDQFTEQGLFNRNGLKFDFF